METLEPAASMGHVPGAIMDQVARIHQNNAAISRATLATSTHLAFIRSAVGAEKFPAVVAKYFGWSIAAAEQLISLCDQFPGHEYLEHVQAGALLLLARDGIPDAVREAALVRARTGFVNVTTVRSLLEAHAAGKDLAAMNGKANSHNGHAATMAIAELKFVDPGGQLALKIVNSLEAAGIVAVKQLLRKRREDLIPLPNFGMRMLEMLATAMEQAGHRAWAQRLRGRAAD